ncbi:MAG: ATP-grasp domain-containing protein [Myxococcales bacterium]|nr:ATP-grasp domain-containing protein [Myxococcales bacterium]
MRTIRRLLVANRGEIARRIFRTCRALGIETVAVFSDADADLPFVREADVAVRIGPPSPAESYLRAGAILEAAARTAADAIHPGYGFLSENAEFAEACAQAGVTFVGPSPAAIRAMGLKRESKHTAAAAGVPVVPGWSGPEQATDFIAARALEVGFPLLVKASAGGGGKGMRVVERADDLIAAIDGAKREAAAAFGDDTLILERYIQAPRHIEVQVLGDGLGRVVALFERECSIQRRHQKVIEEAPSPFVTPDLRARMCEAAVRVASSIGYANAGTVELIVDPSGEFYFLEMNTRLQVEHPVTEAITGIDLVAEQLRIAEGRGFGFDPEQLAIRGAAIEARLYAEDAPGGFLPAAGHLAAWATRPVDGLRVDSGVEAGDTISIHYDPMIAKVIAHGPDRETARRRLLLALRGSAIVGLTTNLDFLVRVLEHDAFVAGELDTHFIERHRDALVAGPSAERAARAAALAAVVSAALRPSAVDTLPAVRAGFRNAGVATERVVFDAGGAAVSVWVRPRRDGALDVWTAATDALFASPPTDAAHAVFRVVEVAATSASVWLEVDGARGWVRWVEGPDGVCAVIDSAGAVGLRQRPRFAEAGTADAAGGCVAPMPGRVVRVLVVLGDDVVVGTPLVILEAMKMEHTLTAATAGRVVEVRAREGDQVDADAPLVTVEPVES